MHFEEQAIQLKKIYYKYNARRIIIDGNGPGIGMIDYLVKSQLIAETGEVIPKRKLGYYKVIYNKHVVKNWKAKLFNIAS